MKIREGKKYLTRGGSVVGPMIRNDGAAGYSRTFAFYSLDKFAGPAWHEGGQHAWDKSRNSRDCIAVYKAPKVKTKPPAKAAALRVDSYERAAADALDEVRRAKSMWPDNFHNAHEGYAVALEEFDELKAHVWTNQKRRDLPAMRKEAIQAAAMCLRFAAECCDETVGRK